MFLTLKSIFSKINIRIAETPQIYSKYSVQRFYEKMCPSIEFRIDQAFILQLFFGLTARRSTQKLKESVSTSNPS